MQCQAGNSKQYQARQSQARNFQDIPNKEISGTANPGHSSQGNFRKDKSMQFQLRQSQARKFDANPGNTISGN